MFAHKSRLKTITHISWMVSRVLLSIIIMSNMFIPIGASADSSSAESADIDSVKNVSEDIANEITLGNSNIPKDTEVPILSEQIAKQAQQKQEEKTVRLRVEAEPAIYTPGQPIRLHWMIEDLKPQDVANAEIVFHAPAGFMPTDPNPVYTPDGLVRIPLSSQTEFSEWNVPADAELPIYFTLDLLINDDLITSQTVMVNQASFAIEKNVRGILGGANGKLAGMNGKVEVEVPANAIDESLYLDIRTPAPQTQPGISLTWQPLEIIAVGKDSRKNVEKFKAPIKIRVKYEESQFPNGDEKALTVYYYDQDVRDWFPIETTVDTENNILTAYSDHLTVFDYKINNWQSQSLPTLDEFKAADFTGAGTYAINLWTPPGPNGLEPALALSYNSQIIDESSAYTQASWVGMGWSLETGSITRNMHGTDTNSQDDTFTISAGGVSGLLLPISSVVNGGVITTTYNTAEQSFMKVENTITINSNTWVATTTDGTRYEFANVARTSITDTDGCSTAAQLDLVWRWSLTSVTSPRVRDASNNPIALTYTYDVEKKSAGCYNDIAVYPLSISYPNGKYSVNFVTESRNDYQTSWTQNASRTLYGTKRLKGILVKHLGITVRRYDLIYASNTSTGNVIYPNFKWSNNNAKTLTLWGVQEFANDTNNPALPAVTFFYGDDLHLTSVANGQGGLVELSYTPWTYYHSDYYNRRSLSTSFGNPSSQDPECVYSNGAWTVGTAWTWVSGPGPASTVGCYLEGSNKYLRVGDGPAGNTAMARRSIPENLAKPGGTYGLYIVGQPFVSPVDEIYWGYREWSTGVEWSRHLYNVPGIGFPDSLVMPVTINPSDTYLFLQCSDCKLTDYHFYLHTTIYRVETRTVSISPINTVAKIYTYHYDNLAPNTFDNSAAVASGGALYFQNESELRGNAMSQVVNSDGLATINWFYQTDALKGRIYDTLIMEQTPASFDGFDSIN